MVDTRLIDLIDQLRAEPNETEWLEFKVDNKDPKRIGEYLSALANAAALQGKPRGYLLFGIEDDSHDVVGTSLDPHRVKGKGNQDLLIWLNNQLEPRPNLFVHKVNHPRGRVVVFEVGAAQNRPISFAGTAYVRIGSSKTALHKYPDKERAIWLRGEDWSVQICASASLEDLDPAAVAKAREQFKVKHSRQADEVDGWDDITFLNKARLALQGRITNAAILLLGRPESSALISPAVAKISWILKDDRNLEQDYEHFEPPFILQVDRVLQRIRNLTLRMLPDGTLFPQEVSQYDLWVIREALHNCIAHQDYRLRGRINVVETPGHVLLTNVGSFLPGDVERVIREDAPLEIYRNPFLAEAMVRLNMIDTQGGGIKRMFQSQMRRFLPLPDYDLGDPSRVVVSIQGTILDERYTRLLMSRTDLDLWRVLLLDKVQKRIRLTKDEHQALKKEGLVEGRYPNLIVAGPVAQQAGQKARHVRERGFDKQYYLDLIVKLVAEHGPVDRRDIDELLMDKLPEHLSEMQKRTKVKNLISELSKGSKISNVGTRKMSAWVLAGE